VISSGGKRNPAKLDLNAGTRRERRRIDQACQILLSTDATDRPYSEVAAGAFGVITCDASADNATRRRLCLLWSHGAGRDGSESGRRVRLLWAQSLSRTAARTFRLRHNRTRGHYLQPATPNVAVSTRKDKVAALISLRAVLCSIVTPYRRLTLFDHRALLASPSSPTADHSGLVPAHVRGSGHAPGAA
jgi:hypothetical protein